MEHAGEGHFSVYLTQEHTGCGLFGEQGPPDPDSETYDSCAELARFYKRYEDSTASPSQSQSLIFGVHHSPMSGSYVIFLVSRKSSERYLLSLVPYNEWTYVVVVTEELKKKLEPARMPMAFQSAIFGELLRTLAHFRTSCESGGNDPLAIHLEVDLFTYRALVAFAERYGLRFRFFPIPVHHQFDECRAVCEQGRREQRDHTGFHFTLEGALQDLLIDRLPQKMRYPVVAFCPGCAKLLDSKRKLQCKQCKIAFYCSVECQKKDWDNLHRQECPKFRRLAAEADCEYCRKG